MAREDLHYPPRHLAERTLRTTKGHVGQASLLLKRLWTKSPHDWKERGVPIASPRKAQEQGVDREDRAAVLRGAQAGQALATPQCLQRAKEAGILEHTQPAKVVMSNDPGSEEAAAPKEERGGEAAAQRRAQALEVSEAAKQHVSLPDSVRKVEIEIQHSRGALSVADAAIAKFMFLANTTGPAPRETTGHMLARSKAADEEASAREDAAVRIQAVHRGSLVRTAQAEALAAEIEALEREAEEGQSGEEACEPELPQYAVRSSRRMHVVADAAIAMFDTLSSTKPGPSKLLQVASTGAGHTSAESWNHVRQSTKQISTMADASIAMFEKLFENSPDQSRGQWNSNSQSVSSSHPADDSKYHIDSDDEDRASVESEEMGADNGMFDSAALDDEDATKPQAGTRAWNVARQQHFFSIREDRVSGLISVADAAIGMMDHFTWHKAPAASPEPQADTAEDGNITELEDKCSSLEVLLEQQRAATKATEALLRQARGEDAADEAVSVPDVGPGVDGTDGMRELQFRVHALESELRAAAALTGRNNVLIGSLQAANAAFPAHLEESRRGAHEASSRASAAEALVAQALRTIETLEVETKKRIEFELARQRETLQKDANV